MKIEKNNAEKEIIIENPSIHATILYLDLNAVIAISIS